MCKKTGVRRPSRPDGAGARGSSALGCSPHCEKGAEPLAVIQMPTVGTQVLTCRCIPTYLGGSDTVKSRTNVQGHITLSEYRPFTDFSLVLSLETLMRGRGTCRRTGMQPIGILNSERCIM